MGRGRAKAKQVKVARQLKYNSGGTDLDRLRAELGVVTEDQDAPVLEGAPVGRPEGRGMANVEQSGRRWREAAAVGARIGRRPLPASGAARQGRCQGPW